MSGEMELKKNVSEMTPEEKEQARKEALAVAGKNINMGGKYTKVIHVDNETFEFKGDIIIHRPTLMEEVEIGKRWALYKQDIKSLDNITDTLCLYFAAFDIIVDKAPDWFKPQEMHDFKFLDWMWGEYAAWRNSFREFSLPKSEGDSETSDSEKTLVGSKRMEGSPNK